MAYLDTNHGHKHLAGVTGVALVHIALAFGLVVGLTIKYSAPESDGTTEVWDVPLPPPPVVDPTPIPDQPVEKTRQIDPIYVPDTIIDLGPTARFDTIVDLPPIGETVLVVPPVATGIETRLPDPPGFTPRTAAPRNGPAGWISNNDYPRRALTQEWEGDVSYALTINAEGRVTDCRITRSSGHDVLDDTACRMIERRARFDPATDRSGAQVPGTYNGRVSWVIPED